MAGLVRLGLADFGIVRPGRHGQDRISMEWQCGAMRCNACLALIGRPRSVRQRSELRCLAVQDWKCTDRCGEPRNGADMNCTLMGVGPLERSGGLFDFGRRVPASTKQTKQRNMK